MRECSPRPDTRRYSLFGHLRLASTIIRIVMGECTEVAQYTSELNCVYRSVFRSSKSNSSTNREDANAQSLLSDALLDEFDVLDDLNALGHCIGNVAAVSTL